MGVYSPSYYCKDLIILIILIKNLLLILNLLHRPLLMLRLKMVGLLDQLLLLIEANVKELILLEDMELLVIVHQMYLRHLLWIQLKVILLIYFINLIRNSLSINIIYSLLY